MLTRSFCTLALCLVAGTASANDKVPLADVTARWVPLLRSPNAEVRKVAADALTDIVLKHPAAAYEMVEWMANDPNGEALADYERRLVALVKEHPPIVSALIRLLRGEKTAYPARNFGVKVLSMAGPAAATQEFIDALSEKYCPVPGAFFRVMKALGRDAIPILAAGYRHPHEYARMRSTNALRVFGRTDPVIQAVFNNLQAEGGLLLKLKAGNPEERIAAITDLTEMARSTPGTARLLVKFLAEEKTPAVLTAAEDRLIVIGREVPEVVVALLAGVRSDDDYMLRRLAMKVLPKVGSALNHQATIDALGDHECPVPGAMMRILTAAGYDALPVLATASQHKNPEIRAAAANILRRMPQQVVKPIP